MRDDGLSSDYRQIISSDYRRVILGLSSDGRRIVFILAEAIQGFSAEILNSEFRGRRSILVRLEGDFACSTHCK